jgi:hypothetical protein
VTLRFDSDSLLMLISFLKFLRRVEVGCVSDVSEQLAAAVFRIDPAAQVLKSCLPFRLRTYISVRVY